MLIESGNLSQLAVKERYEHSVSTYDILLCQQSTSFIRFRIIGEKLLMALLLLFELVDALLESIVAKKKVMRFRGIVQDGNIRNVFVPPI